MDDVISRQDAIEVINKLMEIHFDRKVVLGKAWQQIKDLPSAQHKPFCHLDSPCPYQNEEIKVTEKKGHWIDTNPEEPLDPRQTCSECGNTEILHSAKFCPNCGADMRGEADGENS